MNKTERLLGIVLELQAKKIQTAEKLSKTFEVSQRTIYRDIDALCESGVPIASKQGEGYSLASNYFLPPISFTPDETNVLLLGLNFVKNNFDKEYKSISEITENKIRVILSEDLNKKADALNSKFYLFSPIENEKQKPLLTIIKTSILENKKLKFDYISKKAKSHRNVSPYKLVYLNNTWYLSAFCYERMSMRNFRIERMESLSITNDFFSNEIFENVELYNETRTKKCKVVFPNKCKRWLEEENFYYIEKTIQLSDHIEITLKYRDEDEIIPWILSWRNNAKIIEPELLKQKIVQEVKNILSQY